MHSTVAVFFVVAGRPSLVPVAAGVVFVGIIGVRGLDAPVDVGMVRWRFEFHAVGASIIADIGVLIDRRVAYSAVKADLRCDLQRCAVVDGFLLQGNAERPRRVVLRGRGSLEHRKRDIVSRVDILAAFALAGMNTDGG